MSIQKEWLDFLREQYPVRSRIKLREMGSDDPCPIKPGSTGSLQYIDDLGTFHVAWDDGRGLGLVIGQDSFSVSPPPIQTLKLYMPMTATYYDEDDPEQDITMDSREAAQYAPQIINALQSERRWLENEGPEEAERGLMAYFDGPDSVDQKVLSAPMQFCSFSPNRKCRKMAGKSVQPLHNYTCRFRPSSLKQADKAGLDGLQTGKLDGG